MKRWMGTSCVVLLTIMVGGSLQILFWKNEQRTLVQAIFHFYGLWLVYFLVSGLAMEHVCKYLNKHLTNDNEARNCRKNDDKPEI